MKLFVKVNPIILGPGTGDTHCHRKRQKKTEEKPPSKKTTKINEKSTKNNNKMKQKIQKDGTRLSPKSGRVRVKRFTCNQLQLFWRIKMD